MRKGRELLGEFLNGREQISVAKRIGVTGSMVSYWVRGVRRPSIDNAFELEDLSSGFIPARSWVRRRRAPRRPRKIA